MKGRERNTEGDEGMEDAKEKKKEDVTLIYERNNFPLNFNGILN
jgi:hypothetical protein